ncbi:MAG: ABC transporter permease, partial [Pseudomonadota bacterium]
MLLRLALRSLANRWMTVALTVFATALSVGLFLGVEKVRDGARASFSNTVSGVDLIVGARSGSVQLLLYSVFRIGNATNNITWATYEDLAANPAVDWIVPLSLGDSHRGFRVLGTSQAYFDHYRFRGDRALGFSAGERFDDLFDAVLGADVAAELGYALGDEIVIAHGIASFSFHDDKPFVVAGILEKTGTPVDRTVHVSLEGIEAIHVDWQGGARRPGASVSVEEVRARELRPQAITAAMIGVTSKLAVFRLQRAINQYPEEPLLAVLPGVALQELWSLVGVAETALAGVSGMVVATALLGMAAMILAGLGERRREMAILRAVGARPRVIVGMLVLEAALISLAGAALGLAFLYGGLVIAQPWLDAVYGLY